MDSFNNDELKFDWMSEHYAEISWMEKPVNFIIDCFKIVKPTFSAYIFEIDQIITDGNEVERWFDVPTGNTTSKYCKTLAEAKARAMADLYYWVKSGQAEAVTREYLSATYH